MTLGVPDLGRQYKRSGGESDPRMGTIGGSAMTGLIGAFLNYRVSNLGILLELCYFQLTFLLLLTLPNLTHCVLNTFWPPTHHFLLTFIILTHNSYKTKLIRTLSHQTLLFSTAYREATQISKFDI